MKVKVKKALLGVPVGTVFEANKSLTVQYELSLGKEYISIEIDLTKPNEWFEIIENAPVWENEEWCVNIEYGNKFILDIRNFEDWEKVSLGSRAKAIEFTPDMYRLLKNISDSPIYDMHELQVKAKELIKELE